MGEQGFVATVILELWESGIEIYVKQRLNN